MREKLNIKKTKPQYVAVTGITYAQVDSWFDHCRRDLKLDLIYPEDMTGKVYPCVVWICGGAWLRMDKSAHLAYLSKLADKGFVVASVEYRTSNEGAYLEYSSQIQAACPWYPPTDASAFHYDDPEQAAAAAESLLMGFNVMRNVKEAEDNSPVSKVTKDAPPFLIIHGTDDHTVPFEQSEILYEKLTKNGCDVKFIELEGADHADMQFFQDELWNRIIEFFDEKLK